MWKFLQRSSYLWFVTYLLAIIHFLVIFCKMVRVLRCGLQYWDDRFSSWQSSQDGLLPPPSHICQKHLTYQFLSCWFYLMYSHLTSHLQHLIHFAPRKLRRWYQTEASFCLWSAVKWRPGCWRLKNVHRWWRWFAQFVTRNAYLLRIGLYTFLFFPLWNE